jgi:hypothetical protein
MKLFWINLVIFTLTVVNLSATPTSAVVHPMYNAFADAKKWLDSSELTEKKTELDVCNASPYLSYLRSHMNLLFVDPDRRPYDRIELPRRNVEDVLHDHYRSIDTQPLLYSFYVQTVIEPYRSRLAEVEAPSTSFCYLDKKVTDDCSADGRFCNHHWESGVCFPDSDATTEGKCVSCAHLNKQIENGTVKNETSIGHLNATCDPRSREPNGVPGREHQVKWLRWVLESSFVFEEKKAGGKCFAEPGANKARAYLQVLMKKHFGKMNVSGSLSLTTPGLEGPEDEIAYKAATVEMTQKHGRWYAEKVKGLWNEPDAYFRTFCSREEGLVCVPIKGEVNMFSCRDCGDEEVKKYKDLMEACHPEEVPKEEEKEEERHEGSHFGKKGSSDGAQQDGKHIYALTASLAIVSTISRMFRLSLNS